MTSLIQSSVVSPASASTVVTLAHEMPCAEVIRVAEEMDAIEPTWQAMTEQSSPMEQFAWSRICASVFAPHGGLNVLVARRGNDPVAIAPLLHARRHGVRHAVMLGLNEHNEPMDLVWRDREGLDQLVEAMVEGGWPIFLQRVWADSPTVEAFRRVERRRAVVFIRPQQPCPFIPLDESWTEPEKHMNSGRRSDLRRARRRAEQSGPVKAEILTPAPGELEELLTDAFAVEAKSWKGQAGTALLFDRRRAEFFRQYAYRMSVKGVLRLCFLRIGSEIVAMQFAVVAGGGFWLFKIGYDQRYASCSPGQLLLGETIRYAAGAGLRRFEFLGLSVPWIKVWTEHEHSCVCIRVYPVGARGMTALAGAGAVAAWRRCQRAPCCE